jgi:hypothetical protein
LKDMFSMIFTTCVIISSSTFLILKFPSYSWTNSFVTIMKLTISNIVQQSTQLNNSGVTNFIFRNQNSILYTLSIWNQSSAFGIVEFFFNKRIVLAIKSGFVIVYFILKCWILKLSNFKIQHLYSLFRIQKSIVSKLALPIWKYVTLVESLIFQIFCHSSW